MRDPGTRDRRDLALLALDIGVVVVLVAFALSALLVRTRLHSSDADAKAIAQWAQDNGVTRLAWPETRREAVRALLDAGVTPVLVPEVAPPAQLLSVNNTPVLVSLDPTYLSSMSQGEMQSGPYTARKIDLEQARRTPIANGESIGEQISRPYLYAPLRDSRKIIPDHPWSVPVTLAAGHYRLSVAVFDPQGKGSAIVSVTSGGKALAATNSTRLPTGVLAPTNLDFDVSSQQPSVVELKVAVTGPKGATAAIHEWEVHRQDRGT